MIGNFVLWILGFILSVIAVFILGYTFGWAFYAGKHGFIKNNEKKQREKTYGKK